jgi:hypothetical protein
MGPYNNETEEYLDVPGFETGHWYSAPGGRMYIVPDAEAEIEGPDDGILERLNTIYREAASFNDVDPYKVAKELELEVIPAPLKRFDPEVGYYHA